MSHLLLQWFCQRAFDHQVEYHAPNNRVPNKRYRFGNQLGQRVRRYIHAKNCKKETLMKSLSISGAIEHEGHAYFFNIKIKPFRGLRINGRNDNMKKCQNNAHHIDGFFGNLSD